MAQTIAAATFASTALLLAGAAGAGTKGLISPGLAAGASRVACACTNLGSQPVLVTIRLESVNSTENCSRNIPSGAVANCEATLGQDAFNCRVFRQDGGSLSSRQLACTLSALDAAGNPTAVVPVDRIYSQ